MPPLRVVKRSNRFHRNETELQLRTPYKGCCYMWFCGEDLSQNAYSLDGCPPKPCRRFSLSNPVCSATRHKSVRRAAERESNPAAKYRVIRHSRRLGRRDDESQRRDLISDF